MEIIYLFKYVMPTLFFDSPKTATKRLGRRILKLLSSGNFGFVKTLKIWDTSPFCVLVSWHRVRFLLGYIEFSVVSRSLAASPRLFYPFHPPRVLFYSLYFNKLFFAPNSLLLFCVY